MSEAVGGNIRGLAASELKSLSRLAERRLGKDEVVSIDLAHELVDLSAQLGRKIGMLVTREGRILEVFVGTKVLLYLPDLGRYRFGVGRLRQLRLIYASPNEKSEPPKLPPDIYADLEKLRLDMVVEVARYRTRLMMTYAYPLAGKDAAAGSSVVTEEIEDLGRFDLDVKEFMVGIDEGFERLRLRRGSSGKTRALLVGVYDKRRDDGDESIEELKELANTAGVQVVDSVIQYRAADPKTLLGKGKLEEIVLRCLRLDADMIIFDAELKPGQWRAITNSTELKVLDRSMLILDIFAQHAKSNDGKVQVELAQLQYNLPRLVEKDAGLSRLSGGIGGRGPGETKLEIGRRRIRERITELEKRIARLSNQRQLRRKERNSRELPVVAILGYTNVGKSTIFNALTRSGVIVEDKLFATLDPTHRRLRFPHADNSSLDRNRAMILTDTVGFIRELPKELVAAFRATLEVLNEADLLIHVVDGSDPGFEKKKAAVEGILREMDLQETPLLLVANKCDLISAERRHELESEFLAITVSATQGEGLGKILQQTEALLFPHPAISSSSSEISLGK